MSTKRLLAAALLCAAPALAMTERAAIDSRIDVYAQRSLVRLSRSADPASRRDAEAMLADVKARRLGGIYIEDEQVPALAARARGSNWWSIIPKGTGAVVMRPPEPPLLVFEKRLTGLPGELDAALLRAYRSLGRAECKLPASWASLVQKPLSASAARSACTADRRRHDQLGRTALAQRKSPGYSRYSRTHAAAGRALADCDRAAAKSDRELPVLAAVAGKLLAEEQVEVDWLKLACTFPGCPPGSIRIGSFCIDKFEYPNIQGMGPLSGVRAIEGQRKCETIGRRLCTETEWQSACKGSSNFTYPYGNTYNKKACNDGMDGSHKYRGPDWRKLNDDDEKVWRPEVLRLYQAEPSGGRNLCVTPDGVADLTGNVAEWVVGTKDQGVDGFVLLGCGWPGCINKKGARCDFVNGKHPGGVSKGKFRTYEAGFRCCADPNDTPGSD